jgi:hypothetical protein
MKYEQKILEVFSKSKITVLTISENGKESYYMNAIENLGEIFKSGYTDKAYGKPIYTELCKTTDNSLFIPAGNRYGRPSSSGRGDSGRPSSDRGRYSGNGRRG